MREPGLPALPFRQPGLHRFVLSRTFETAGSHAPAPLHPLRAFPDDAASEQQDAGYEHHAGQQTDRLAQPLKPRNLRHVGQPAAERSQPGFQHDDDYFGR